MNTATVADCATCRHRKSAVYSNERAVSSLARRLTNAQNRGIAPHQQRGLFTQLTKAKDALANSRQNLEDHQYGDCGS